jgi:magnesium transporter
MDRASDPAADSLLAELPRLDPRTAAQRLAELGDTEIANLLAAMHTGYAVEILEEFPEARRATIAAATPFGQGQLWLQGHSYAEGTVGRLIERPPAVFRPTATIAEVIADLREIVKKRMVTYIFVTDAEGVLKGVVAFRELLFSQPGQTLAEVMIADPFVLRPTQTLVQAMHEVVTRHYPVYPVTDEAGRLLGMVRGQVLFEQQAFEISAQAGSMVGVEKEERIATPIVRSFLFRHPWLQINLLTAFAAAAVVGYFEGTLEQIVILAIFLPVVAGQCGNTATQTLAITLRALTLNELKPGGAGALIAKEVGLGAVNGVLVGLVAGAGMWWTAANADRADGLVLGAVVVVALAISCAVSGIAGVSIPLILKRFGADPATASGIFLSTVTDVTSMGVFLGLATLVLM